MARFIGIRHRIKKTIKGEARPTMVAIRENHGVRAIELEDETAELDFMLGTLPTGFRDVELGEDLGAFKPRHVKRIKKRGSDEERVQVPVGYEGFQTGDVVAMTLGGSGDRLAYALSRRGEEIGAVVIRIPPFHLAPNRHDAPKDDDHLLLARLAEEQRGLFYDVGPRDRNLIFLAEAYRSRKDAQGDRIKCEDRLRKRTIGAIFCSSEGRYPEGTIEDVFDQRKSTDVILTSLQSEEARRDAEVRKAARSADVWTEILSKVGGCGEVLAAGIITPIADIRRFPSKEQLKAFAGVHVLLDGRFVRRRAGAVSNWNPQLRQALYLLGHQFVLRPESAWGQVLRAYKVKLRAKHPEVVVVNNKKRYTDGHIQKMAYWRTITRFVEWFWRQWMELEERQAKQA